MKGNLQMDSLLELFNKYNCHLKRGNVSMKVFLHNNFKEYISDLRVNAVSEKKPVLGQEMCCMVSENIDIIENNANKIVEVFDLYEKGKIVSASIKAFEVFDNMKPHLMQRYSGTSHTEVYYRIRPIDDNNTYNPERKELFHIPKNKNYLVRTERYSMPGHPCLYLASQAQLCWYECGKPEKFAVSKFDIPQTETSHLKFIDFSEKITSHMHNFNNWFRSQKDLDFVKEYFLKYICIYPLRAACSVIAEHPGSSFVEEYIIPQLLLQWVLDDEDFDGIRYESCSASEEVKYLGGHNVVLVTNDFDEDGFDIKLRNCIKVGEPTVIDINKVIVNQKLEECLGKKFIKENPFSWGFEKISEDYRKV